MPGKDGEIAITSFTAAMLTQTFEGLMQALITQRERNVGLMRESLLSPRAFAAQHIGPEMARAELLARFGETKDGASPVDAGQPYIPPGPDMAEEPPIFKLCGIQFGEGDYGRRKLSISREPISSKRAICTISATGAQRVADAVVSLLAEETLEKLRMLVAQGLPEVKVESGRILTKASFRVDSGTQNSRGTEQMLIRALNLSGPEGFKTRAGMSGEMEVRFSVVRSEYRGK
jgi:hypothetical protein